MDSETSLGWPAQWSELNAESRLVSDAFGFLHRHGLKPNDSPDTCIAAECQDNTRAALLIAALNKEGNSLASNHESAQMRLLTHLFSMISLVRKKAALWCEDRQALFHHPTQPEEFRDSVKIHAVVGARTTVTRRMEGSASTHRIIDGLTAFYTLPDNDRTVKLPHDRWMFDEVGLTEHYRNAFSSEHPEQIVSHVKGRRWDIARAHDTAMQIASVQLRMGEKVKSLTSIAIDNGPEFPGLISPNSEHLYFPQNLFGNIELSASQIRQTAKATVAYKRGAKMRVQ